MLRDSVLREEGRVQGGVVVLTGFRRYLRARAAELGFARWKVDPELVGASVASVDLSSLTRLNPGHGSAKPGMPTAGPQYGTPQFLFYQCENLRCRRKMEKWRDNTTGPCPPLRLRP